jgi:hypothetical protein
VASGDPHALDSQPLGSASSQVQDFENIMKNLLFFSGSAATLRLFVISIIFLEVYLERAF